MFNHCKLATLNEDNERQVRGRENNHVNKAIKSGVTFTTVQDA